jgi:hypothetical protein
MTGDVPAPGRKKMSFILEGNLRDENVPMLTLLRRRALPTPHSLANQTALASIV